VGQLGGPPGSPGDALEAPQPPREPDEDVAGRTPVAQVFGRERGQPDAVVEQLLAELAELEAVLVPDDRRGLVGDRVPGQDRPDEDVQVLPPAGGCARTQRLVEAAQVAEGRRPEGEVRSRSELPGGVGVELSGKGRSPDTPSRRTYDGSAAR
jgi:hypothetical protein